MPKEVGYKNPYPNDNSRSKKGRGGERQDAGLEPSSSDNSPLAQQHREITSTARRVRGK